MATSTEEFRDSDVRSEPHFEDYGCTWIGVIVALIVIVAIMMIPAILGGNIFIFPGFVSIEPNTEVELVFVKESLIMVPIAVVVFVITWAYYRRTGPTLEEA